LIESSKKDIRKGSRSNDRRRSKSDEKSKNDGNKIIVRTFIGTNLYIANLSKRVREKDLEAKFSKFGIIKQCMVVRDPITRYKLTTSNSYNSI
jgi:RNA recognition motif-containing protein